MTSPAMARVDVGVGVGVGVAVDALALTPPAALEPDRRRGTRVPLWGLAEVTVGAGPAAPTTRHLIDDLSFGGAQLTGGPAPAVGAAVEIVLRVPFRGAVRLRGDVAWRRDVSSSSSRFAVTFREPASGAGLGARAALLEILSRRADKRIVIVVDEEGGVSETLGGHLRRLGCVALVAETTAQARQWLLATEGQVHMVIVSTDLVRSNPLGFLAELEAWYPGVRRVVMSGRARPPSPVLAHGGALAHATLCLPWSPMALAELLVRNGGHDE